MRKTVWVVGCAVGVFLMILSVVLTVCGGVLGAEEPSMSIVGGMDGPTFWFLFREGFGWMAALGFVVFIVSAIGLLWKRKN